MNFFYSSYLTCKKCVIYPYKTAKSLSFGPTADDDDAELLDSDMIIRYREERARDNGARFFAEI